MQNAHAYYNTDRHELLIYATTEGFKCHQHFKDIEKLILSDKFLPHFLHQSLLNYSMRLPGLRAI